MKALAIIMMLFAATLMLTACGGPAGPTTTIDVTLTDFSFTPNEYTVPAGQEITIHTVNNGAVIHEFVIMKLGTEAGDEFDEEDESNVYWEIETPVGQTSTGTFTAPTEPGDYEVVCGTPGHIISGMVGTLHVLAP